MRTDYESADYEKLLHRLNDATDRYHILGGDNREAEIEKTLDTINLAYEKLLDSFFEDAAMDIKSDITVLETMLAQEGLTKNPFDTESGSERR